MPWPISNHGSPDVDLRIPRATAPHYLWAILQADGEQFRPGHYEKVREYLDLAVKNFSDRATAGQAPKRDVSEQRLRTIKSEFEDMGLLTVDTDNSIKATRFGRAIVEGLDTVASTLDGANRHIAQLGAQVANRVMLAAPGEKGVPADADLLPLRAIWRAFRKLGDRLHWQDVNRVLGHIHYENDVEPAISQIAQFRKTYPTTYPTDAKALAQLGPKSLSDDPRHITPWFNRAGLGGMLLTSEADKDGFRLLVPGFASIIEQLLGEPAPTPPAAAWSSRDDYIDYLMEPVERSSRPPVDPSDLELVDFIQHAVKTFGNRKIVTLSGLPGTGKSRIARIVADQLTDGDPQRLKDIQFHESTAYEDFIEGFVPRPDGQGFERRDKTFRIINQRALDDQDRTYVLLIEEFTRANVHSVLGEVLTFVEHRGRKFTLSLSQEEISIAPNLVILATMNPRDRSALMLDDAIGRRMHRVPVPSSSKSLRHMLQKLSPGDLDKLAQWFDDHTTSLPFGHGVFAGATDATQLSYIWQGTVVPLFADALGQIPEAYKSAYESFPFSSVPATGAPKSGAK